MHLVDSSRVKVNALRTNDQGNTTTVEVVVEVGTVSGGEQDGEEWGVIVQNGETGQEAAPLSDLRANFADTDGKAPWTACEADGQHNRLLIPSEGVELFLDAQDCVHEWTRAKKQGDTLTNESLKDRAARNVIAAGMLQKRVDRGVDVERQICPNCKAFREVEVDVPDDVDDLSM